MLMVLDQEDGRAYHTMRMSDKLEEDERQVIVVSSL
jgi:hypothetical protein